MLDVVIIGSGPAGLTLFICSMIQETNDLKI